jgi:hypothetical protein
MMRNRNERSLRFAVLATIVVMAGSTSSSAAPAATGEQYAEQVREHISSSRCTEIGDGLATSYRSLLVTLERSGRSSPLSQAEGLSVASIFAWCWSFRTRRRLILKGVTPNAQPELANQRALNTITAVLDRKALNDPGSLSADEVDALRDALRQLKVLDAQRSERFLGPDAPADYQRLKAVPEGELASRERESLALYDRWYNGTFLSEAPQ